MAILLVELYLESCRELAGHVYIMDRGEIVHSGPSAGLENVSVRRYLTVQLLPILSA